MQKVLGKIKAIGKCFSISRVFNNNFIPSAGGPTFYFDYAVRDTIRVLMGKEVPGVDLK